MPKPRQSAMRRSYRHILRSRCGAALVNRRRLCSITMSWDDAKRRAQEDERRRAAEHKAWQAKNDLARREVEQLLPEVRRAVADFIRQLPSSAYNSETWVNYKGAFGREKQRQQRYHHIQISPGIGSGDSGDWVALLPDGRLLSPEDLNYERNWDRSALEGWRASRSYFEALLAAMARDLVRLGLL